jgi:hypothetical protein
MNPDAQAEPELDSQQLVLLDALLRSREQRASFDELREAGVELPASVVEELELIGLPLERCSMRRGGSPRPGVWLRSAAGTAEPAPTEPVRQARCSPPLPGSRPSRPAGASAAPPLALRRWTVPALLVGAFAATIALAVTSASSDRTRPASPARVLARAASSSQHRPRAGAAALRGAHLESVHGRAAAAFASGGQRVAVALAAQLETRGHELLESGREQSATQRLSEAIAASGEHVDNCLRPASEACLTYAYALYDLGRALAAEGRSAEAAFVLEQRLRIANQRDAVAAELQRVRDGARTPPAAPGAHPRPAHSRPLRARRARPRPAHAHTQSAFAITGGVAAADASTVGQRALPCTPTRGCTAPQRRPRGAERYTD